MFLLLWTLLTAVFIVAAVGYGIVLLYIWGYMIYGHFTEKHNVLYAALEEAGFTDTVYLGIIKNTPWKEEVAESIRYLCFK